MTIAKRDGEGKGVDLINLRPQQRQAEIRAGMVSADHRTVTFPFSSEVSVERWFGKEVLDHSKAATVRMDRLNAGAPLLFNHRQDEVIGVVEKAWVGDDNRAHATVRFARTARAEEVLGMVNDDVLRNVSFMYRVHQFVEKAKSDEYRATDWEPMEVSIVAVPADYSVGIGRAQGNEATEARILRADPPAQAATKERSMSEATAAAATSAETPAAAAAALPIKVEMNSDTEAKLERARCTALSQLGERYSIEAGTVRQWIDSGASLDRAGADVITVMEKRSKESTQSVAKLGLSRAEASKYSFLRAVLACATESWRGAEFEAECSAAVAQKLGRMPDPRKFFVPLDIQERAIDPRALQRDMTVASNSAGGYLVATDNVGFIELLRNRSVCFAMGARRLSGLQGNVTIPKQTGAATAIWLANEASTITESTPVLSQLPLSPKTVGAYTEISRQLILQSNPSAESMVMADLAAQVALAVDLAGLEGTGGSGQPTGISGTSGVGSVTGTTLAYAGVIEFQTDVAAGNVMPVRGGYVTTPAVAGLLMGRQRFSSTDTPLWDGNVWNGNVAGFPAMSSNQLTAASMIFGDWDKLVIAEWGVLEVEVNPYANFQAGIIGIRAMYSVDIGVRYAVAFSRATTIT